jgi:hypothetical protein
MGKSSSSMGLSRASPSPRSNLKMEVLFLLMWSSAQPGWYTFLKNPEYMIEFGYSYDEPEIAFRPTLGDLASKLKIWDLDDEGEVNGLWRKSGIPNLWIMMGWSPRVI